MHVAGVSADASTFEHVEPGARRQRARAAVVCELAGRASMLEKAAELGIELDDATATRVLERVKELEHEGYQFEAADGSLELLLRRETGGYEPLFRLESWRVIVEQRADGEVQTEATIKIWRRRRACERSRRGQRPGQRARPRAARGDRRGPPAPRATSSSSTSRSASSTRTRAPARSRGCSSTPPTAPACGARSASRRTSSSASWQALVDSLERGMLPEPRRERAEIPLAQPLLGEAEEEAVLAVLRSGRLSLGPLLPRVRAPLRRSASARRTRAPSRAARPGCTSRCAPSASATATRWSRARSRSSRRPT